MKQNLCRVAGYNLIAILVVAGISYPIGIILRPEGGIVYDSIINNRCYKFVVAGKKENIKNFT